MVLAKDKWELSLYGLSMALLLFLLRWLELRLIIISHAVEIYTAAIALIFTLLGIWLARRLLKPEVKTVVVEKPVPPAELPGTHFKPDADWLQRTRLSEREQEVLRLMAEGHSNQEIAEKLFLSLHTIKSHSTRMFEKLEVKRRTQAVEKARRMGIVP